MTHGSNTLMSMLSVGLGGRFGRAEEEEVTVDPASTWSVWNMTENKSRTLERFGSSMWQTLGSDLYSGSARATRPLIIALALTPAKKICAPEKKVYVRIWN